MAIETTDHQWTKLDGIDLVAAPVGRVGKLKFAKQTHWVGSTEPLFNIPEDFVSDATDGVSASLRCPLKHTLNDEELNAEKFSASPTMEKSQAFFHDFAIIGVAFLFRLCSWRFRLDPVHRRVAGSDKRDPSRVSLVPRP